MNEKYLREGWNSIEKNPVKSGVYETISLFGVSGIQRTIEGKTMFDFQNWQTDESQKVIAWKSND